MREEPLRLPPGYRLEEDDPDFVDLHGPDGSRVAVFNALGAKAEHIRTAAEEDRDEANLGALRAAAGDVLDTDMFDLLAALHVAGGSAERLAARSPWFAAVARAVDHAAAVAETALTAWEDPSEKSA
jgi:hypothetical protein